MSSVKSKGNRTTEAPLASEMRRMGIGGWRRHVRIRVGSGVRPDFVFPRERLAVFVQGCYWHNCPLHGSMPKSNAEFWAAKFRSNRARDRRNRRDLKSAGWSVLVIWEHAVKKSPRACAERVLWELYRP